MPHFQHYDQDTAIVLACSGSEVEHDRYELLAEEVREAFPNYPVKIAISSRLVIRAMAEKGSVQQNLPQTLANLDLAGYRRIVVVSCFLYPIFEYQHVVDTVQGFKQFSRSNYLLTSALLNKTKMATRLLAAIYECHPLGQDQVNLFISREVPQLDSPGYSAIQYSQNFLRRLDPRNFSCSIDGAFPFHTLRNSFIRDMKASVSAARPRVRLIPMVMVSCEEFEHELDKIREELGLHFDIDVPSPVGSDRFCLLDLPKLRETLVDQVRNELNR